MKDRDSQTDNASEKEIYLWDYVQVLLKNRKMIVRNCLVVFLMALIVSLVLPKKYISTATLLPPEETPSMNKLGGFSPNLMPNLSIFNMNSTAEIFVRILLSRSVQQPVLERKYLIGKKEANLFEYFGVEKLESAMIKLTQVTSIAASPEGIISISVEMGTPTLAAAVANAYVAELDSVNRAKSTSQAKNSRIYIENQLDLTKNRLSIADKALADFMQSQKAISLEAQTQALIEGSGELKGRIIAKEVELAMKKMVRREDHSEIRAIKAELNELQKQYYKMQYGSEEPSAAEKSEFVVPMAKVPDISLQLAELMREVKVQETVFELLNQQFYQAKIQEAKDTPTVQVLDGAIPPNFKSKPKRGLIILLAIGSIFILSIFLAFFNEYLARVSAKDEHQEKLVFLKKMFRDDFHKIKETIQRKRL